MTHFPDNSAFATRMLPQTTYDILRRSLLEQASQPDTVMVTEADLDPRWTQAQGWAEVSLLVTPSTQGLLVKQQAAFATAAPQPPGQCTVGMMVDPYPVNAIIAHLMANATHEAVRQRLRQGQQQLRDRPANACPELMLTLLSTALTTSPTVPDGIASSLLCRPVQAALDQQIEKDLLLNQVITKIRQSLDLHAILSTTVEEVRQFLQADRLLIYQFQIPPQAEFTGVDRGNHSAARPQQPAKGYITYESRSSQQISSVIHFTEEQCFDTHTHCRQKYLTGIPVAVNDIQAQYRETPCMLNFLQKAQVQAKVIAPIIVQHELWGLLIAHQCRTPREWQPKELAFLQHIAEHLAIAVQQADLYQQLQSQTQSLEACVVNRTQELRDALAAAQAASHAKSEFLATMSHELRTPLTCIIGLSATLLRWSFGELSPRQRNYLTTIHQSGERLLALINDILEMSKIESGRTALEVRSFSITSLAQQTLESFRQQARDRDITLTLESSLLAGQDEFTGDPRRIRQILDNLLSNALKFTNNDGRVNLRVWRENQMAAFQVEDTGIGIPESQLPLLFEKFQQLEASRQRQYPGTGLGLALTKQLAELHGGGISVTSRVGVGSVFTVRLPLQRLDNDKASAQALIDPAPISPPIVGRIVLVEDHDETAGIICDLLTAADYQVIWVIEGSRVVEQVALLQPTVVIINMQLGGIDGQRIIQALRNSLVTAKVKILALNTLHENSATVKNADAAIALPLDPEVLLERVNALIAMATL